MRETIEAFIQDAADLFVADEIDAFCARFAMPCTVYVGVDEILVNDSDTFRAAVAKYRQTLRASGLTTLKFRIARCSMRGRDRATVTLACRYFDAANGCLGANTVNYYIRHAEGGWRIEMTEYAALPFGHRKTARLPDRVLH